MSIAIARKRPLRFGFDVDGVIQDFHGNLEKHLLAIDPTYTVKNVLDHDIHKAYPHLGSKVTEIVNSREYYRDLKPINNGIDLARRVLNLHSDIYFLTSRPIGLEELTFSTLKRTLRFPDNRLLRDHVKAFGTTKAKTDYILANNFDAFVDDNPQVIKNLLEGGFNKNMLFLFKQPWNLSMKDYENRMGGVEITKSIYAEGIVNDCEAFLSCFP